MYLGAITSGSRIAEGIKNTNASPLIGPMDTRLRCDRDFLGQMLMKILEKAKEAGIDPF